MAASRSCMQHAAVSKTAIWPFAGQLHAQSIMGLYATEVTVSVGHCASTALASTSVDRTLAIVGRLPSIFRVTSTFLKSLESSNSSPASTSARMKNITGNASCTSMLFQSRCQFSQRFHRSPRHWRATSAQPVTYPARIALPAASRSSSGSSISGLVSLTSDTGPATSRDFLDSMLPPTPPRAIDRNTSSSVVHEMP